MIRVRISFPFLQGNCSVIRRGFGGLFAGLVLACALLVPGLSGQAAAADKLPVPAPPKTFYSIETLKKMADSITKTGVAKDAIASLYRPQYLNVSDASLSMDSNEPVFVVTFPTGLTRIYPQRIMVWHEVVNDVLPDATGAPIRPDTPLSALDSFIITYSPLTGAVAAYYATAGRFPSTFGVTGELLNADTLLYDHMTGSVWVQLTGVCIDGPMRGKRLSPIQAVWATWRGAKERYPKAQVLSRSTGYRRSYGRDPYGSYQTSGNYYDDLRLTYPVYPLDNRLPPKQRILGIEGEGVFGAVRIDAVRSAGIVNTALGLQPLLAVYDPLLDCVFVYNRTLPGRETPLTFIVQDGKIMDTETKTEWTTTGLGTYGPLRERALTPVLTTNAMWFAWASFYPQTIILPETGFVRRLQ